MLESTDIQMIKAVSECGSLSKASEILNLSQPTLSKRLARLEQILNISLFFRYNGGMRPTEASQYVIQHGEAVQCKLDAIKRHVEMLSNLECGQLNIGVGPIIEQLYFPKVLLDFIDEAANVKVRLITESGEKLIDHLTSGNLDIIIGPFTNEEVSKEFVVLPVQKANIIFVARADHPILQNSQSKLTFEAISMFPLIAPGIPSAYKKAIPKPFSEVSPAITCDNYFTSKSVVTFSDYITAGPEVLFERELVNGTLVKLPADINLKWTSNCAIRPESLSIPSVKRFIEVFDRYLDN